MIQNFSGVSFFDILFDFLDSPGTLLFDILFFPGFSRHFAFLNVKLDVRFSLFFFFISFHGFLFTLIFLFICLLFLFRIICCIFFRIFFSSTQISLLLFGQSLLFLMNIGIDSAVKVYKLHLKVQSQGISIVIK